MRGDAAVERWMQAHPILAALVWALTISATGPIANVVSGDAQDGWGAYFISLAVGFPVGLALVWFANRRARGRPA